MVLTWRQREAAAFAAKIANGGGVIAYPTEAVWGLGCDPFDEQAVNKILRLKQRPISKGMILVASQWWHIKPFIEDLSQPQKDALIKTWPGPMTWLVPNNGVAPVWITGGQSTIALRLSANPLIGVLCDKFKGPLVSTSANPQARPPARNGLKVRSYFGREIDFLVPGLLGGNARPTEIRHLLTGEQVRF